ncbi:MAG TPA: peptidoglycan-binding protein [Alphaproteobacteria bacterium]|nr:peptidoglycan-binding protein [Alphaproteobacteria bacterium]
MVGPHRAALRSGIAWEGQRFPKGEGEQQGQPPQGQQQSQQKPEQQQQSQQPQLDQAQRRQIEERLKAAGFDPGPVDGVFTGETATALLKFQSQRGLPATGLVIIIDEATRQALMREQQPKAGEKAASQAQGSRQAIRAVKASTLVDMPVRNQQGEMMGEVEDVMIDPSEGRVAYVILDLGGWFDIGGNLVAAPTSAHPSTGAEYHFAIHVPEQLDHAKRNHHVGVLEFARRRVGRSGICPWRHL